MKNHFVFNDVIKLANYVNGQLANPTPIKIQKSLYFTWAFYSASYGSLNSEKDNSEFTLQEEYPEELFEPDFEAWRYGPVIQSVYTAYSDRSLSTLSEDEIKKEMNLNSDLNKKEIVSFINDLLDQVDDVNDFGLVQRSHEDSAWKDVYEEGAEHCKMISEQIKADYLKWYEEQN